MEPIFNNEPEMEFQWVSGKPAGRRQGAFYGIRAVTGY